MSVAFNRAQVFKGSKNPHASEDFQALARRILFDAPSPGIGRVKVWTGSEWAIKSAKVWDGSAWGVKPVKVWTGTAWVPMNEGPPPSGAELSIAKTADQYAIPYPGLTIATLFGPASTDRRIVCSVVALGNTATFTIAGVAAEIRSRTVDAVTGWGTYYRYIIEANVPTGTTGNIVASNTTEHYGGTTWAITGAASVFDQVASGAANSGSITVDDGGVVVIFHSRTSSNTITAASWMGGVTGTDVQFDTGNEYYCGAYGAFALAQTVNYSVTYTGVAGGVDLGNGAVSFKVAP